MARLRADVLLVRRGLATHADEAQRRILAGRVFSGQTRIATAGELVDDGAPLEVRAERTFVSRGGDKLCAAIAELAVPVGGRVCLDAGCSTGGFTDCLLQRGARLVHAVDVGYGQLAWSLRTDERVRVHERTNVRHLAPDILEPRPDLLVADLSFISLRAVLPALVALVDGPSFDLVLLVKPQFELERDAVAGGVVRDPALHERAVELVIGAARPLGLVCRGRATSVLLGPKGNRELFVWLGPAAVRA
jgi:23S rRNA (cytidine1920-2'-O)/16S rRNA (cytidine1409-2'-O)-methyltransferase